MERLEPRVRVVWVVAAIVRATIFVGVVWTTTQFVAGSDAWDGVPDAALRATVGVAIVLGLVHVVVAWLRYSVWRFEVQDDAIYIERGVFTRVKTVVPYVRLQHVDSRRSALERTVGLATVVVYSAGSRTADVSIPGLTPERAEQLREELRRVAIESEGEDAL